MRNRCFAFVVLFACLFCGVASAGAIDIHLKLDGVPGESNDASHKNEIELISMDHQLGTGTAPRISIGIKPGAPIVGAPAAAATVRTVGPITLTKYMDVSSPQLMTKFNAQEKIPSAALVVRRLVSQRPFEFLKVNLQGVTVSSYQVSMETTDSRAIEVITLSFDSIEWQYMRQNPDGTPAEPVSATYIGLFASTNAVSDWTLALKQPINQSWHT